MVVFPDIAAKTSDPPAVRVERARLAFRDLLLFDGLDLELAAGRTTCLLGPSGVGKSSLLRLVAGLEEAAAGSVADAAGRPLAGRIAYMAQRDLLLPWCSVLDNVLLGFRLRGAAADPAAVKRARELLAMLGLSGTEQALPATLSGGMRQRVALARTLVEDRPVILMDEPFSALDAITRYQLQDLAAETLSGRTVLLVTHDPLEALRLGHRIHVLSGRPARLDAAIEPASAPPRDAAGDPALLALQSELLKRLTRAQAA